MSCGGIWVRLSMIKPFVALAVASALGLTLALSFNSNAVLEFQNSQDSNPLIKTYLVNMRSLEYEKSGKLKGTLEAPSMQYYSGEKVVKLVDPRYFFHDDNAEGWSVTSRKGHFFDKQDMLFLEGNVVLTNHQNGNHLNTEEMQLNLQDNIASSNILVTITQGPDTISALGMVADLSKERINMKPNVESTYVPVAP